MKKLIFVISFIAVFGFFYSGLLHPEVKAATVAELQEQPVTWCHDFNVNLRIGDSGSEVTALQTALSKEGLYARGITGTFDEYTASAVVAFQEKYASEVLAPWGLEHGTGYVGPTTRAKLNEIYSCQVPGYDFYVVPGYDFYVKTSDTGTGNWSFAKSSCEALGSGWSLPTMAQLRILQQKKNEIGGFEDQAYWSSDMGMYIHFSNGFEGSMNPAMTFPAFRCVKEVDVMLRIIENQLANISKTVSILIEEINKLLGR